MPSFLAYRPGLMSHLGSILIQIAPFWVNFRSEDAILEQNFAPDPMGWVPGPKSWPQGPKGAHGGPRGPMGALGGPRGPKNYFNLTGKVSMAMFLTSGAP